MVSVLLRLLFTSVCSDTSLILHGRVGISLRHILAQFRLRKVIYLCSGPLSLSTFSSLVYPRSPITPSLKHFFRTHIKTDWNLALKLNAHLHWANRTEFELSRNYHELLLPSICFRLSNLKIVYIN